MEQVPPTSYSSCDYSVDFGAFPASIDTFKTTETDVMFQGAEFGMRFEYRTRCRFDDSLCI